MEGAIRNLVAKKVLNCMCGAFSDKWLDVSQRCGKQAEGLKVDWGSPIRAAQIDAKLATGQFDALTLIHGETSGDEPAGWMPRSRKNIPASCSSSTP